MQSDNIIEEVLREIEKQESVLSRREAMKLLALSPLAAGVLGTARIILQHHTLGEVMGGFAVGLICTLLVLHPLSKLLFRLFSIFLF